jgi:hypothetical protein
MGLSVEAPLGGVIKKQQLQGFVRITDFLAVFLITDNGFF